MITPHRRNPRRGTRIRRRSSSRFQRSSGKRKRYGGDDGPRIRCKGVRYIPYSMTKPRELRRRERWLDMRPSHVLSREVFDQRRETGCRRRRLSSASRNNWSLGREGQAPRREVRSLGIGPRDNRLPSVTARCSSHARSEVCAEMPEVRSVASILPPRVSVAHDAHHLSRDGERPRFVARNSRGPLPCIAAT